MVTIFGRSNSNRNINATDRLGRTLLHLASLTGEEEYLLKLVQLGSDVSSKDIDNATPKDLASAYEDYRRKKIGQRQDGLLSQLRHLHVHAHEMFAGMSKTRRLQVCGTNCGHAALFQSPTPTNEDDNISCYQCVNVGCLYHLRSELDAVAYVSRI